MKDVWVDETLSVRASQTIRSWWVSETAPWFSRELHLQDLLAEFRLLNCTTRTVFLFHLSGSRVLVVPKPAELWDCEMERRSRFYEKHLSSCLASSKILLETIIAVCVGDGYHPSRIAPTFAFQKKLGSSCILLPDIDFIHWEYYEDRTLRDPFAYHEKSRTAVFAGATTGGRVTQDAIEDLSIPRLRAGIFFKDSPLVDFCLPKIVQCDSPQTIARLEALGFGGGLRMSWKDQFTHRFLLSIDGNGATCSRVAIGLLSNSVLMKYDSDSVLYYFKGLSSWLHYVPIKCDKDVLDTIEREKEGLNLQYVAAAGKAFAEDHLSRNGVMTYTIGLLKTYSSNVAPELTNVPIETLLNAVT